MDKPQFGSKKNSCKNIKIKYLHRILYYGSGNDLKYENDLVKGYTIWLRFAHRLAYILR